MRKNQEENSISKLKNLFPTSSKKTNGHNEYYPLLPMKMQK